MFQPYQLRRQPFEVLLSFGASPAGRAKELLAVEKCFQWYHQLVAAITGFIDFVGRQRFGFEHETVAPAEELKLLLDTVRKIIKDFCPAPVLNKAPVDCTPGDILAVWISEDDLDVLGFHDLCMRVSPFFYNA